MAPKKPVRTPITKNSGGKSRGEAKIMASEAIANAPKKDRGAYQGSVYGLRTEGAELLGNHAAKTGKVRVKAVVPKENKVSPARKRVVVAKKKK